MCIMTIGNSGNRDTKNNQKKGIMHPKDKKEVFEAIPLACRCLLSFIILRYRLFISKR